MTDETCAPKPVLAIAVGIVFFGAMVAGLFLAAGRWDWWPGWAGGPTSRC